LTQLVASLNRFYKSGSIFFAAELPNPFELRSASELRIEMPSPEVYTELRARWKARDYKNLPLKGICILDDQIGTHNSVMTIKFVCKPLGKGEAAPYPARLAESMIRNANDEPYGYIDEYSYSFYPDMLSTRAREIGYVRYDFHPHLMGRQIGQGFPNSLLAQSFQADVQESLPPRIYRYCGASHGTDSREATL
jgi:hypothetical protein